uniref:Uncharacterized protein n=1 Tax=Anopheles epiroticus TaxID=199890 RepID=A0A182PSI0_9DIPT
MERVRGANSEAATVRHVLRCEAFDSHGEAKENTSFYQNASVVRGFAADACYLNAVFNDSSETFVDEEDGRSYGGIEKSGTNSQTTTAPVVNDPSAMVRVTVASTPAGFGDGAQPFRRSHSMRSSFNSLRGLRTKLKPGASGGTAITGHSARLAYCHLPTVGDLARSPAASSKRSSSSSSSSSRSSSSSTHFARSTGDDMRRSLRNKLHKLKITYNELRRLQTKVLQDRATALDESSECGSESGADGLPENIPPKAAALLMEGFSRTTGVQSSLKVHRRHAPEVTRSVSGREIEGGTCVPVVFVNAASKREDTVPTTATGTHLTVVRRQPPEPENTPITGRKSTQQDGVKVTSEGDRSTQQYVGRRQSESPGHQQLTVTRTATIRKGSVWANNTTSKSFTPEIREGLWDGEKFSEHILLLQECWEGGQSNFLKHRLLSSFSPCHALEPSGWLNGSPQINS